MATLGKLEISTFAKV